MSIVMTEFARQREILDRRALAGRLDELVAGRDAAGSEVRSDVLEALKSALAAGREEVRRRFDDGATGADVVRANCFLIDQIIRVLHDFAQTRVFPLANPTKGERLALVAVGGYGRGELAPHSDIDLLFLHLYKSAPHSEQIVEFMLYMLWDLGLKVGHATRNVDGCLRLSRQDITIRTSLLESRFLWGERSLYDDLRNRFQSEIVAETGPAFVEEKLAERDARHQRMGDSRYFLEPNIKEGKGGLRDLHTLFWIAKYLYQVASVADLVGKKVFTKTEAASFAKAEEFLWTVRCHLHYLTNRAEERLTFDLQPRIAEAMGYSDREAPDSAQLAVERFMKHYFLIAKDVGDITRIFCAALEAEHERKPGFGLKALWTRKKDIDGFPVREGRVLLPGDDALKRDPVNFLRLFHIAQKEELDVHPAALRRITRDLKLVDQVQNDPEANQLFLEMLTSTKAPEITLRRLNEAGVFGRFIPDFGRVVAQMQHDMYHVYTVDEHTLQAIGLLHEIEEGRLTEDHPLASGIIGKIQSRRALYVAVLLHDIAKGRGGDHSELGADVAKELGPRFGLSDEETETVAWLVLHHLAMSNTAQKRDIHDPKTIIDFAELVQSVERLRLLLTLTIVDMRATGPKVWNGWKAQLLRDLYYQAEEFLSGEYSGEGARIREEEAKAALRAELTDWIEEDIEAFMSRGSRKYWLTLDTPTHTRHAELVRTADRDGLALAVDRQVDTYQSITEVTVYTDDQPGLFYKIAGAIALTGGNIVDAQIFTLNDGKALDTFRIQDAEGSAFAARDKLARLVVRIEQALSGRLTPGDDLAGRETLPKRAAAVFKVPPRVIIDNNASRTHTVIEVNGQDRPALLHDVTKALTDLSLQIGSAKISTFGERVVDVFYVKDLFGMKIDHESKHPRIRKALLDVLDLDDTARMQAAE